MDRAARYRPGVQVKRKSRKSENASFSADFMENIFVKATSKGVTKIIFGYNKLNNNDILPAFLPDPAFFWRFLLKPKFFMFFKKRHLLIG